MRSLILFALIALAAVVLGSTACTQSTGDKLAHAGRSMVVDCMGGEVKNIRPIAQSTTQSIIAGTLDWEHVEDGAVAMGARVGGCFLAHLYDLLPRSPNFSGDDRAARALANMRRRTDSNLTYRTDAGER